jgi:hypothetical protein
MSEEIKKSRGRPKLAPDSEAWSFRLWYQKNKDKLSKSRKNRYKNDREYREKVIARNKQYRKKNSSQSSGSDRPRKTKLIEMTVNQTDVRLPAFHISNLAAKVNRSVPTLYGWERNGILPRTPFVTGNADKQERLYTSEMMDIVVDQFNERNGRVSVKDRSFYNAILVKWSAIGVYAIEEDTHAED